MTKEQKKIVSFLKGKIDEASEKETVKTVYCSQSFDYKLSRIKECYSISSMRDFIIRGISGFFQGINIVSSSHTGKRVILSSELNLRLLASHDVDGRTREEWLKENKKVEIAFKTKMEEAKILEFNEEELKIK